MKSNHYETAILNRTQYQTASGNCAVFPSGDGSTILKGKRAIDAAQRLQAQGKATLKIVDAGLQMGIVRLK